MPHLCHHKPVTVHLIKMTTGNCLYLYACSLSSCYTHVVSKILILLAFNVEAYVMLVRIC